MTKDCIILGLESSCDDTAAAVLRVDGRGRPEILSSIVFDQNKIHATFGGVVPEIAARAHAEKIDFCAQQALSQASVSMDQINMIAATSGPGLIGGVMTSVMFAKGLSVSRQIPLYGVNHLAGHALTPRLTDAVPYPYLMLLVSGGHCQFLLVQSPETFTRLGGTIDDAPGEAFDKVARALGLPQPGGPHIEQEAAHGDENRFSFPRPLKNQEGCNMSFSGLKTAVLRSRDELIKNQGGLKQKDRSDLCASFQTAVADSLAAKSQNALKKYLPIAGAAPTFCVAGGVAANSLIRDTLAVVARQFGARFLAPDIFLCTDNAAMIAYAGYEQSLLREPDGLKLSARPRWPLDTAQPALIGGGRKGAKA